MPVLDSGSSQAGKANVDATYNLRVNTPGVNSAGVDVGGGSANAGAVAIFSENDPGTLTGSRYVKSPETSADYRLRVGLDTIKFVDTFNAITQNTSNWSYTFATMTASQPGAGTVNFGTVQGTTNGHGAFMRTFQYFPVIGTSPLAVEVNMGQFNSALVPNEEWYVGLGLPSAAATIPTDGIWMKLTTAGWVGELCYNSSTVSTGVIFPFASTVVGEMYKFTMVVGEHEVEFWKNDVLLGEIAIPASVGQPFQTAALPVFFQKRCTGVVSNTNTMRVSDITVSLMDIQTAQSWADQLAVGGKAGQIGQNGQTQGKTSLWANSGAPTAAAAVNATSPFTGLGGIVAILPTLAQNTDGNILSFQNPASTINITGRNLVIKGIRVQGAVSVILAGGPVIYAYALAFGHTAVSLATPETGSFVTATTHAPRIVPIGIETYATNAAVGVLGSAGLQLNLSTPIVVRPGEFVSVIARNMGVVTTTGAISIVVSYDAYWE